MKQKINERLDLGKQFAKRLTEQDAGHDELERQWEEYPDLKELYHDITAKLHTVDWKPTDRQEWLDFQKKYLFRKQRRRNLILRYAAVACVLVSTVVVLSLYFSRREELPVVMSSAGNLPTLSVSDQVFALDSVGIERLMQQKHVIMKQTDKELAYLVDSTASVVSEWHTIRVPRQAEFTLVLTDGSRVRLNTGTTFHYPVPFTGDTREVRVEGEAFFEVAPDRVKPFVVHFEDNSVTVLGTEFNISCYKEQPSRTTLVKGSVRLSNSLDSVVLLPGQEGIISSSRKNITVREADMNVVTAWLNNRFYFKELPLSEIMKTLGEWYDVGVLFDSKNTGDMLFSIETKRYEDIDSVLTILESTKKVKFTRKDNMIQVKSNL
jgi:putative anti-sigma factor